MLENLEGELALWSRNGRPLLRYFPELAPLGELLPPSSALDGEVVIVRDGALDFDAMQTRLHPAESRIRRLAAETPASYVVFDLLLWDGEPLWQAARSRERRAELERRASGFRLSPAARDPAVRRAAWLDRFEALGLDGVVAKRLDLAYLPGSREAVVKVKEHRSADCVVVGLRWKGEREAIATLLLGLYRDDGGLDYVGTCAVAARERDSRSPPGSCRSCATRPSGASLSRTAGAAASSSRLPCAPSSSSRCATTRCRATASATARSSCAGAPTRIPHDCTWRELRPARPPGDEGVERAARRALTARRLSRRRAPARRGAEPRARPASARRARARRSAAAARPR